MSLRSLLEEAQAKKGKRFLTENSRGSRGLGYLCLVKFQPLQELNSGKRWESAWTPLQGLSCVQTRVVPHAFSLQLTWMNVSTIAHSVHQVALSK